VSGKPEEGNGAANARPPGAEVADEESRYRLLVEQIPAIVYMDAVDSVSTNLYTSPQIGEILGIPHPEWVSNPELWVTRMHPDDRERVLAQNDESNRTGQPFRSEYRIQAADGRWVWLRDEAVVVRDDDGKPLFWRGVQLDITELKETEEKLTRSLQILRSTVQQRRALLSRLEQAQEEERRRIAADIHDDSIQVMSAADMRLQLLARQLDDAAEQAEVADIQKTVTEAIERLRHLLFELRPPVLDREGLVAALRIYLERAQKELGLEFSIDDRLKDEPPGEVRATLFRIMQEALGNVRKHAQATRVDVLLQTDDDGVLVRIVDDGAGFDREEVDNPAPGHLGLTTMHERAELAAGRFAIRSASGEGTTVEFWLPLHPEELG